MNFRQFLSILRARRWVALPIFLLIVGAAVGLSLVLPKQYTATATLVVDQTRPDPIAAAIYGGNPSPAFMATQVDVLKSDRVAQQVVRKLGLTEDPKAREAWMKATEGAGSLEAWLIEKVQLPLDVKPPRESNVISVGYKSSDPVNAATMANAFAQAYMDVTLELRVDPAKQYSSFFDTRSKELRVNVERAQAKLSAYQREKGVIIASDGQLDVETARLNELSSQLVALQAVAAESSSRQAQAQAGTADRLQEVINNPVLSNLRGDITHAEARLQELTSRLGDNHPQVIEAKANIASLRTRLDAETRRVTGSLGVANTINRQREAEIRASLEAQRARVLRLRTAREEGAVLIRDMENAQRAYEAVLARLNQTSLESQTTQSNVVMLAQAVPPVLPSSPKVVLNTVISIVLGLAFAMGAAMLMEVVDRRLHAFDEVSELIGLPLLGVLPGPGGKGRFAARRTPLVSPQAMFRQLPAPAGRHDGEIS
jgi:polysaccharide biosynthesis transport protein